MQDAWLDEHSRRRDRAGERAIDGTVAAVGDEHPDRARAEDVRGLELDVGHGVSLRAVLGLPGGGLLRAAATGELDDAEKLGAALAAELLSDRSGRDASPPHAVRGGRPAPDQLLDAARSTPLAQNVSQE